MNDDGSNKVNPLLQAYADKILAEYKQELIDFLDNEIDSKEHFLTTGYGDHWDAGMIYAFQLTKEFIQQL